MRGLEEDTPEISSLSPATRVGGGDTDNPRRDYQVPSTYPFPSSVPPPPLGGPLPRGSSTHHSGFDLVGMFPSRPSLEYLPVTQVP